MTAEQVNPADARWNWDEAVPLRWLLLDEFTMGEPDTAVAVCAEIDGLFADPPAPADGQSAAPARLVGCRPGQPLRAALDALARGAGAPGGAVHRRRISAFIYSVAEDGIAARVIHDGGLFASVAAVCPSPMGAGLLDVTFDAPVTNPLPSGASGIWDRWRSGRPAEPGLWSGYDSSLRREWSGAALAHHQPGTRDSPAGATYHLDGRHVSDIEGFYCAMGEAVNGPGGYFGWNPDALHDCLRGGWGATRPFRLIWHDAAVARKHLPEDFDQVLQWFAEGGIKVEFG